MSFKLTWKSQIILLIISVISALLLQERLTETLVKFIINVPLFKNYIYFSSILYSVLLIILVSIIHEMIHGAFYKIFGGKVRYGIKMGCAYTQEITGIAINKYKFVIILLMPLTIISLISLLLLPDWIGELIFWFNLFGSIGDMYMAAVILLNGKGKKIIDREYGFDVI